MKVTFIELLPLDGAGTMINHAYKWLPVERVEFCDTISKMGNMYYMMRGGYVFTGIKVENITKIEYDGAVANVKYYKEDKRFSTRYTNKFGKEFAGGYSDFSELLQDIRTYSRNCI